MGNSGISGWRGHGGQRRSDPRTWAIKFPPRQHYT